MKVSVKAIVQTLRLVGVGGQLAYRALFNWTSPPMFVGTLLAGPLFQLLFYVYLGRQLGLADDRFYVLGNAILAASVAGVYGGTMAVANERRYGTLGAVLLSPRRRAAVWAGRLLPYVGNGLLVSAFTLAGGCVLLGVRLPVHGLGVTAAAVVGAAVSCAAFGLLLGALGLRFRDVFVVSNLAASALLLLSGAEVPARLLPLWMRDAGALLPLAHALDAARGTAVDTASALAAEFGLGLGYAFLAVGLMSWFERSSRRHASLDAV